MAHRLFLHLSDALYTAARPLIFRDSAQVAHERVLTLLRRLDERSWTAGILRTLHGWAFERQPVEVGGAQFDHPLILAAGFVKGLGFADEETALDAVAHGVNVIPGWRAMPALVGAVEFGSFTRWPRPGNPGVVLWRDVSTRSTQNRVGLKNPGARAAAAFLACHKANLPPVFGINVAVSPGVSDPAQEQREVIEALDSFLGEGICPAWFTLNISCPNTEDDPGGHQTETRTRDLCGAVVDHLANRAPLWVKVSPDLAAEQYAGLLRACVVTGVRAIIATNTLAQPTPDASGLMAGVGGGRLHDSAVAAAATLVREKRKQGYTIDIVGCGGVLDGRTYRDFTALGAQAVQYWSAVIYRGPLAGALIVKEGTHAG